MPTLRSAAHLLAVASLVFAASAEALAATRPPAEDPAQDPAAALARLLDVDAPPPAGFDRDAAQADTRRFLSELIAIDTTNSQAHDPSSGRPNGNELATAEWFHAVFVERFGPVTLERVDRSGPPGVVRVKRTYGLADGIETHIIEVAPGRANFIARIAAGGRRHVRPVLVMGHMDVVGADEGAWSVPPFEATVSDDGYLYGRGAIDCKGPLAAELTAVLALAARRSSLSRDIVFFATAAEEGGPGVGVDLVLAEYPSLLGMAEFALNEGGRIRLGEDGVRSVNVQTTEKLSYAVAVEAKGPSGHGSVPLPDNALAALARAVARVHDWRAPVRLNDTTRLTFRQLAAIEEDPLVRAAMEIAGSDDPSPDAFERAVEVLSTRPLFNATLRAGQSLTMMDGGFRTNVIPSTGSAVFNVRALPDDDITEIVAAMEEAAGEPSVSFTLQGVPKTSPPVSSVETALYRAMEEAAGVMAPGAVVVPFMSTGATDGAALRRAGVPTYGILPIPLRMEDELRMHGNDERAPLAGLGWAAEYVYRVLAAVTE